MKTRQQYAILLDQKKRAVPNTSRVRNPCKNTAKRIMRRAYLCVKWDELQWNMRDERNYFLFNSVGARLYIMSTGNICNREPRGYQRYLPKK